MGQAVSTFFTTTVVDVAKKAWSGVVNGVTVFAKWIEEGVQSFVTSVVNSISNIIESVKNFFINAWHNIEEFTNKIFHLKPNVKDYAYNAVYEVGKGMEKAGIKYYRKRLKELGQNDIDSLTDEQVAARWKEYMDKHPLTAEDKADLDNTFGSDFDSKSTSMITGTGGYSKFSSPTVTGLGATSPHEAEVLKKRKDHVINHVTFVLLSPEHFKKGLPKSVSLTPAEVQELNRLLSS